MREGNLNSKPVLLIGPLPNEKAGKVGGARVSFQLMLQYFKERDMPFQLINTRAYDVGWKRIANPFRILFVFLANVRKTSIVFVNVSQGGTRYLIPAIFFLSRFFGKKIVFRPFGGGLLKEYQAYSSFQKWLFDHTALKVDLLVLQTKALLRFFQGKAKQVYWLPTSRIDPVAFFPRQAYRKRLVFFGHVKEEKGIDVLLEAFEQLHTEYTLHIYGPLMDKKYESLPAFQAVYKGILCREEVQFRLRDYDILILPTFFHGEGYPGVIVEAYSMGIPVIATRWQAIPEMIDHHRSGILIPARSAETLVRAVRHFNADNYPHYSACARKKFLDCFDAGRVSLQLFQQMEKL